jgi:hypothetical protein
MSYVVAGPELLSAAAINLAGIGSAQKPIQGPVPNEQQGEAIGFLPDGSGYITTSEGIDQYLSEYTAP